MRGARCALAPEHTALARAGIQSFRRVPREGAHGAHNLSQLKPTPRGILVQVCAHRFGRVEAEFEQ
eukprot:15474195-Alexandrium_andersonii.AAC.1